MENVDKILADTMSKVVENIETMALTHGDKAVELALFSYQMEATQVLAKLLFLFLLLLIPYVLLTYKARCEWDKYSPDTKENLTILGIVFSLPIFLAFSFLIDLKRWYAAFGYPELMIATKVLKTAV
jgi:Ca2+/Na+ antiporter